MSKVEIFKRAMKGGYEWTKIRIAEIDKEIAAKERILTAMAKDNSPVVAEMLGGMTITERIFEIDQLKARKKELENLYAPLNKLKPQDRQMIIDVFTTGADPRYVAKAYGMAKSGMYKRINDELEKIL